MANLNLNRVSAFMTDADFANAEQLLNDCQMLFPFLTELDEGELRKLNHISVNNHRFVAETISVVNYLDLSMPAHINMTEISNDLRLFDQLQQFIVRMEQFLKALKNTAALSGSEAYVNSLFVYKIITAYAEASVPGAKTAYDRLSERFKGQGPSSSNKEATEEGTEENSNSQSTNDDDTLNDDSPIINR